MDELYKELLDAVDAQLDEEGVPEVGSAEEQKANMAAVRQPVTRTYDDDEEVNVGTGSYGVYLASKGRR